MYNMKANLLLDERHIIDPGAFVELVVWRIENPLHGSRHMFKNRMALVVAGECKIRFDNESGKGDHCHPGERELAYKFSTPDRLMQDFWEKVDEWRKSR
jgi:hypothetical protein